MTTVQKLLALQENSVEISTNFHTWRYRKLDLNKQARPRDPFTLHLHRFVAQFLLNENLQAQRNREHRGIHYPM